MSNLIYSKGACLVGERTAVDVFCLGFLRPLTVSNNIVLDELATCGMDVF